MLIPLLAVVLCFGTTACNSSKKTAKSPAKVEISDWNNPDLIKRLEPKEYANSIVLRLERTSCFGTCPVYTTVVYSDGSGLYNGRYHAKPEGKFTFKLTPSELATLLAKAESINYFKLDDVYEQPVTDMPTTYTYVNNGKERKQIRNYRGAPAELKEFEKLVDEVTLKAGKDPVK